jgi:very-short-patch-repair endonuclease
VYGVYADSAVVDEARRDPLDWLALRSAACVRSARVPAMVAGTTAAALHGLPVPSGALDSVVLWRPGAVDLRGVSSAACGSFVLDEATVVRTRGFPMLDRPEAAVHAALGLSPEWALAGCDAVLASSPADEPRMRAALERITTTKGRQRASAALALARPGAESPLESISRFRLMQQGLPEPRLQVPFFDRQGFVGRTDMVFDELGVVGEADGLAKYQDRADLVAEKRREDRLRALGMAVVRWTWDEIWSSPREVADRIRAARGWSRRATA